MICMKIFLISGYIKGFGEGQIHISHCNVYLNHIRGNALNWFETFLKRRKQFTSVNGACSKTSVIGCGVPQGSVLGPLLFLLYVNDIQNAFTSATPKLYADDINIFCLPRVVCSWLVLNYRKFLRESASFKLHFRRKLDTSPNTVGN